MKTKEEILMQYESFHYTENGCDETHYYKDNVLLAMEEYANQQLQLGGVVGQSEQLPCERCKKLEFMIENGLGWKDMENNCT